MFFNGLFRELSIVRSVLFSVTSQFVVCLFVFYVYMHIILFFVRLFVKSLLLAAVLKENMSRGAVAVVGFTALSLFMSSLQCCQERTFIM